MWREEAKEQLGALLRVRELQERVARLGGRARVAGGVKRSRRPAAVIGSARIGPCACAYNSATNSPPWAVSIAQGQ
jgi:hypothetical protein